MQAYCVKCRTKREMKYPKSMTMKNGYPATWVRCHKCGTKIFRKEEYNPDYCINIQLRLDIR
ncbi:DUF5679 domain-containing protein [Chloroflexota bacterium]